MLKKKTIVAGERVSYRRGAEKRKKASVPHPKQYGTVEKLDDKTKSLLHIIFDSGERRQLLKSKVTHEDPGAGSRRDSSSFTPPFARIHVHARAHEDGNARTLLFEIATQEESYNFLTYIKRRDFRVTNVG